MSATAYEFHVQCAIAARSDDLDEYLRAAEAARRERRAAAVKHRALEAHIRSMSRAEIEDDLDRAAAERRNKIHWLTTDLRRGRTSTIPITQPTLAQILDEWRAGQEVRP